MIAATIALCTIIVFSAWAPSADDDRPRIVLLLYGESRLLPAVVAADEAIRETLGRRAQVPIEFHTEYLESLSGIPGAQFGPELTSLLKKKYARPKPDVIMAGRGAARFVLERRAELFPDVPVILLGVDRGQLPRELPPGVTAVFAAPHWAATLEAALTLQPHTKRAIILHGAAEIDRHWMAIARRELAPFESRIEVRHLAGLPLDRLRDKAAALPDRSVILVGSILADQTGRSLGARQVAEQLAPISAAPMYGLFESQLGRGIVGGKVLRPAAYGTRAAELALRILDGERLGPADSIEAGSGLLFDARQLARWHIGEAALPAGSVVLFREPSMWTRYRWLLIGGLALVVVETILIGGLLLERRRRRIVQHGLAMRLRFERLRADLTTLLARVPPSEVDSQIDTALAKIVEQLDVDRVGLAEIATDRTSVRFTHRQRRPGVPALSPLVGLDEYPWTVGRMLAGASVAFSRVDELPPEADADGKRFRLNGTQSFASVPLRVGGAVVGALRLATVTSERTWSAEFMHQLELLSDIFGNAIGARRADEARREQEDRFRVIADAAPVMICMSGADTKSEFFNKRWLEFTGRRLEEELGTDCFEPIHADDVQRCLDTYLAAFKDRRPFSMEYRLRRHDGAYRSVLHSGAPRLAPDGSFLGYVGSCVDVTEIKEAQLAVVNSSALSNAMLESLRGRVAALDARGVIIATNRAWTETSDAPAIPRAAVDDNYLDVVHGATPDVDTQRLCAAIEDILAGRTSHAVVEYGSVETGNPRWFELSVERLKRPSGGALVIHNDITERRRADEELRRHREELTHALRVATLGELSASLAHEITQPLTAILSSAQTARQALDAPERTKDVVSAAIDYIIEDSQRAAQVVRRLRALFRKEHAERKPIAVNQVILDVVGLTRNDAARRGVSVDLDLAGRLPIVIGDVVQIQQVVLNVLLNALEATAGAAEPRQVTIGTRQTEPGVLGITVADTGTGVESTMLDKMFEPFVSAKSNGLGMGLSISRSIVQSHGGRIWATTNGTRGLTIQIELPCEKHA